MKLPVKKAAPARAFPEFAALTKPSYSGTLTFPEDVTRLSLSEVSKYHAQYVSLHCYALSRLTDIRIKLLRMDSERTVKRNTLIRNVMTYGARERWKMDRTVETNPEVEKLAADMALVEAQKMEIELYVSVFEKYALALSREITRRGTEGRHG